MLKNINVLFFTILVSLFIACSSAPKKWQFQKTINLGEITPIGLTHFNNDFWIADGDHNQIVQVTKNGTIKNTLTNFERPMHLSSDAEQLYIPEYGSDTIRILKNGERSALAITDSLDAPAGVTIFNNEIAIADFYNHRILYFDGTDWSSFGKEGKAIGELYYPTDVEITTDKIFVADAYNNRVQVFDKKGKSLQIIGEAEKMNAATGIYVNSDQIFITDFEHDRVLVYDHTGNLQQEVKDKLEKPTDILQVNKTLYIANYKGKNLQVYQRD